MTHSLPSLALFCFSGTGNSLFIANTLKDALAPHYRVELFLLEKGAHYDNLISFDYFGFVYPIHAFNPPKNVLAFIKHLPRQQKPYFIAKIGGDTTSLNHGASYKPRKILAEKGYTLTHDYLFAMPSNIALSFPAEFSRALVAASYRHAKFLAQAIVSGMRIIPEISRYAKIASTIGISEQLAAKWFGRSLHTTSACNMCGKCARNCPTKNISEKNGKMVWGWKCVFCMRCIYGCPQKAILPAWFLLFAVVKPHYSLSSYIPEDLDNAPALPRLPEEYRQYNAYLSQIRPLEK